jgi:hypothetical protein
MTKEEKLAKLNEINSRIAALEAQLGPDRSPLADTAKEALTSQAGPVGVGAGLADANPVARRTALTTAGAEAALPLSPVASGAAAAAMGTVADVADNPGRALKFGKQVVKTAADLAVQPSQVVPDLGKFASSQEAKDFAARRAKEFAAGTAAGYVAGKVRGIDPEGPLGAGAANPELAIPGQADKALDTLGAAKNAARAGEDLKEAARLRRLIQLPAGRTKLSEEAIDHISNGTDLSPTQLLAYREALGKVSTKGGTFANDFAQARRILTDQLEQKVPGITRILSKARAALLAKGQGDTPLSLIGAVMASPVARAFKFPGASTVVGALGRGAAEALQPAAQASIGEADALSHAYSKAVSRRKRASGR